MGLRIGQYSVVLCLVACSSGVTPPDDIEITCASDADCIVGVCATALALCRPEADSVAPSVVSALATSPTQIEVVFSEPLHEPPLGAVGALTFEPPLDVVSLSLTNGNQLAILTAPQRLGYPYDVAAPGVFDEFGNPLTGGGFSVVGFGPPVETDPPNLLNPLPDATVHDDTAVLAWSARRGVVGYEVEVATDSAFTQPVTGSPFSTSAEVLTLELTGLEDVDYYWRVRSELSGFSQARFGVAHGAVHVYCPATQACDASASALVPTGSRGSPFRSVTRGLSVAVENNVAQLRVADRGNDEAYPGPLFLEFAQVDILGGYDASFADAQRDPVGARVRVSSNSIGHRIDSPTGPVLVSGMHFSLLASGSRAVGLTIRSDEDVTLQDVGAAIDSDAAFASAIEVSPSGGGETTLIDVDLDLQGVGAAAVIGLLAQESVSAERLVVRADVAPISGVVGVQAMGGTVTLMDPDVDIFNSSAMTFAAVGVSALVGATTDVQGGTVRVSGVDGVAAAVSASEGTVRVEDTWLIAAGATIPAGLWASSGGQASATNVLIAVDGTGGTSTIPTAVLNGNSGSQVTLTHSTVLLEDAWFSYAESFAPILTNNLVACLGGLGGHWAPSDTLPASMQNNGFINCPIFFRDSADNDTTDVASLNALDGAAGTCGGERINANVATTGSIDAILGDVDGADDDLTTAADNVVGLLVGAGNLFIGAGRNTSAVDCGPCGGLVSCGNVTVDRTGAARPASPSLGAVEP